MFLWPTVYTEKTPYAGNRASTFFRDDAVADEILLVGDKNNDVVAFSGSKILQTGLGEDK